MSRTGKAFAALCIFGMMLAGAAPAQQAPASNRVLGTVASVTGTTISVKTDAGSTVSVTIPDGANIMRVPPGQKTLAGATKIVLADVSVGDRVLMLVSGDPPAAKVVVVNKQSDIAAKQQQEQADWAKRGVGGLVKAVDPSAGTVTITATNRTITIHTTPNTIIRRYAPDSVNFADAQTSTLAAIQPGDQVTARGDRTGDDVTAEEIVSGSFRNIAGTVVSVDGAAGTFTVKDLVTKKTVTIKTTPDSDLRKLDPQMAQMIAMRLRAGGGQGNTAGANSGAGGGAGNHPNGGQYPPGGGGPGGAQGGGNALARVLQRSPEIHVSDLHKGDAVMIVATSGNPDSATAIRLLAGVEPMLQASASGSQSMFSSAWSGLGGGSGGEGEGGGEGAP
jgi:hypothetical protein